MRLRPNKVNVLIFLALIALSSVAMAQTQMELSEDQLEAIAKKGSPKLDEIQSALLRAQVTNGETDEKFAPELFGKASYAETNERAIVQFQPIFSPTKRGEIGVRQSFKQGFKTSAAIATQQQSAVSSFTGKFRDVTTTVASFTVQMDLWRDLFGRMSKAAQDQEIARLQKMEKKAQRTLQENAEEFQATAKMQQELLHRHNLSVAAAMREEHGWSAVFEKHTLVAAAPDIAKVFRKNGNFSELPILAPARESVLRRELERWWAENDITPLIRAEFDDGAAMLELAAKGLGAAPVHEPVLKDVCKRYGLVQLPFHCEIEDDLFVVTGDRQYNHTGVTALMDSARGILKA
jgi:hypothetical protein